MFHNQIPHLNNIYHKETFAPNKKYITEIFDNFTGNIELYTINHLRDIFAFENDISISNEEIYKIVVENDLYNKLSVEGQSNFIRYKQSLDPLVKMSYSYNDLLNIPEEFK